MASLSPVQLCDPFCSYCGRPPGAGDRGGSRVCGRCHLGMVLRAPAGEAPKIRDPFLIVDEDLIVRAISQRAEIALGVREPEYVDAALDLLLQPASGIADPLDLALLVRLAVAASPIPDKFELRAADPARPGFCARVTTCGPPPAALLVLAPLSDPASRGGSNGATRDPADNEQALARA
jgi:hypothetical protein